MTLINVEVPGSDDGVNIIESEGAPKKGGIVFTAVTLNVTS